MRFLTAVITLLLASLLGCERVSSFLKPASLPDMGPRLPMSIRMDFDPSLTGAIAPYADSCNHPEELRIGAELESVLMEAAYQTFQGVQLPGSGPTAPPPDIDAFITLPQSGLRIQTDGTYDRLPAELTLHAMAVFRDRTGKVVGERPLNVTHRERLILEPTQKRCAYVSIDKFLHDAVVDVSTQFMREARALFDTGAQSAAKTSSPQEPAPKVAAAVGPPLSFKATILDENGNVMLEGGERVTLRVELANTGMEPANGVSVAVSGPAVVVSQFPSPSLPVGALQPGESRSVEFSGTLPQTVEAQRIDLTVTVTDANGARAPSTQTVAAMMRPRSAAAGTGPVASSDNVDRIPAAAPGFQRPHTYLIAVGISSHRDPQLPARKYAALDAELVAAYFRDAGGVPASNVRVLQDWKALRAEIEEVVLDWLPLHTTQESVVVFYFAGQARVSPVGETFLVPYEGGQSIARLLPVKDLGAGLGRLRAKHIVFIFDGSIVKLGGDARARAKEPQWELPGHVTRLISTGGVRDSLEPEQLHHGLFTYYLLRGLRGDADENRDREVSLNELMAFLRQAVPSAARANYGQEQRPLIIPPVGTAGRLAGVILTKSSSSNR